MTAVSFTNAVIITGKDQRRSHLPNSWGPRTGVEMSKHFEEVVRQLHEDAQARADLLSASSDQNRERAAWADHALEAFTRRVGQSFEADHEDALVDLLADLFHLAETRGYAAPQLLSRAVYHFMCETIDDTHAYATWEPAKLAGTAWLLDAAQALEDRERAQTSQT